MSLLIALVNAFATVITLAGIVFGIVGPHVWPSHPQPAEVRIVVMHDQSMTITAPGHRVAKPNTAHHHHH